jgi:eukaryotic-like serine/threonine-protein kinase
VGLSVQALSGPLVLPADVLLVPVGELSEAARRQLRWQEGDYAITRPRLRTPSRLVDAGAAGLLREFVSPSTVVEAVVRHSRARGADPEATLEAAYPLLARLVREGFLVAAADAGAERIGATWAPGERVAGLTVLSCVQVLEDTEVYQVRGAGPWREAALKIERSAGAAGAAGARRGGPAARLFREALVLDHLARAARAARAERDGAGPPPEPEPLAPEPASSPPEPAPTEPLAPRLAGHGVWAGRRFLALEWCAGIDALSAAAELREGGAADGAGRQGEEGSPALLALCRAAAGAYARLHRQGVLHCDVHPRNVLVGAGGGVRLIDFGLARWPGEAAAPAPAGRGGIAFYLEPEYAAAALAGRRPPPATAAGEQYAVAALLYLLAAGVHYLDFSLERDTLLRQIVEGEPLPFAARGAAAWPGLEAVLARALAKAPEERFPTLDALAAALADLASPPPAPAASPVDASELGAAAAATVVPVAVASPVPLPSLAGALRRPGPAAELLGATLARLRPGGPLWETGLEEPPFASLQFGSAGIAYALYRVALAREDAELLSQADLWAARAAAAADRAGALAGEGDGGGESGAPDADADPAFYNPRLDITPETVGRASLFHTAPGVRFAEALIANALDDREGARRAAAAFAAAARRPCPNPDLTLGRSGLLLGCALLLDALGAGDASSAAATATPTGPAASASLGDVVDLAGDRPPPSPAPPAPPAPPATDPPAAARLLSALGDELLAGLWQEIDPLPPLAACAERPNLGIAHGWAGYLYATLQWCRAAARPLPAGLAARLDELGDAAESWGRGARWRWLAQPPAAGHRSATAGAAVWMAGWCNGSAGMAHLYSLAARLLGGPRPERLAMAAAWHAWETPDRGESLCCGLAGRAYALLELHRRGAGAEWLSRARQLADRAAAEAASPARAAAPEGAALDHSLYRGQLGLAVLAADLERPAAAAMPAFAEEGWGG